MAEKTKTQVATEIIKFATGVAAVVSNSAPQAFPKPPEQQMVEKASDAYAEQRRAAEAELKPPQR